ncbi:hypothetical protein V6N13_139148 [Hibiscus sabdariffa]
MGNCSGINIIVSDGLAFTKAASAVKTAIGKYFPNEPGNWLSGPEFALGSCVQVLKTEKPFLFEASSIGIDARPDT